MRLLIVVLAVAILGGVFFLLRPRSDGDGPKRAPEAPPAPKEPAEAPPPGEPWFVDEAEARGITLLNRTGRPGRKELILSAIGPGAAVFDANRDGRLDIYIPNGSHLVGPRREQLYDAEDRPRNALYIQRADGTFVDEAKERGVDDDAWGFGACAADLDNDGDSDLLVANLGPNRLYLNDGTGNFTDIAAAAGIAGPAGRGAWEWSNGFCCGDYDKDGRLDLYLTNYADIFKWLRTDPDIERDPATGAILNAAVCEWHRLKVYCGPLGLPGQQDRLFRNTGGVGADLAFEDVTRKSGVFRPEQEGGPQYGFQPLFTDLNRDGWPDIYVANDSVPSFFLESQGDGTFLEKGTEYGIARGDTGKDMAGMGADVADVDGDGWYDVVKTNFALETNNLYVAEPFKGRVTFRDFSMRTGLERKVFTDLGWGALLFDFDLDGDCDVFFANGHVYPEVDHPNARGLNTNFHQFNKLFRNDTHKGRLRFSDVPDLGPGFEIKKSSRGASLVDFDSDGDLDIVVVNLNDTPELLVNRRGSAAGRALVLTLIGNVAKGSNRDAIGSRLTVRRGDGFQVIETRRGRGFLGNSDPRVHIGLGRHAGPVVVEIVWPNGETREYVFSEADRFVEVRQE